MDKRNTILLTVIAIATLLVAVVGATFAYFATTQDINANVPVALNTAGKAASFTSESTGELNIQVDSNEMQQSGSDDNTVIPGLTNTATLTVSLGAAAEGQSSVCTYDIIFTWTSEKSDFTQALVENPGTQAEAPTNYRTDNDYYVRTIDPKTSLPIPREFTIIATGTKTGPDSPQTTTSGPVTVGSNTVDITEREINFDEFAVEGQRDITVPDPNTAGNTITKKADYMTLLKGLKIESASLENKTSVAWNFVAKFYNATKNQTVQMGRSYTGVITVNPDTIQC